MRPSLLVTTLLITSTLPTARLFNPGLQQTNCRVQDIARVEAAGQKIYDDIIRYGEVPEADLATVIQSLIQVINDCLTIHLKKPGTLCYDVAFSAEQAIVKLVKDVNTHQSKLVIGADIFDCLVHLRSFAKDCLVPVQFGGLNKLSDLN